MKLILPAYLFLETLSLLMVFTLLTSPPSAEVMGTFERFGYATAAMGVGLSLVLWLKKKYRPDVGALFLIFISVYPIALWSIYELVHNSPKMLPQSVKPYALQRAYKTLSGVEGDKPVADHIHAVMARYPLPDESVRQINLDGIRGLSKLYQTLPEWSKQFDKGQYQRSAELSLLTNVVNYSEFLQRYDTAFVASLAGLAGPLTSRTVNQLALLQNVDPGLIALILSKSHKDIVMNDVMKLAERRFLKEVNKQFPELVFDDPLNGRSWDVIMRQAITMKIMVDMGLFYDPEIVLPWVVSERQFREDPMLLKLSQRAAPYLFDANGAPLISLNTIKDPAKVATMEKTLRAGLPDAVREQFDGFFSKMGLDLSAEPNAWSSPIADPLFSGWLRVGAILPIMLIFSLIMILVNTYKLRMLGGQYLVAGFASVALAIVVFNSFLIGYLIKVIILISVPEPILFSG